MSSTPPSTCSQIAHTAPPSSPAHSPTLPATTTSPSRTWTSPLFARTARGKASNEPGGLPHVPGGDGRAEHRHGARPYRCLPNPSPVTRRREVLPMTTTDTDALKERIAAALTEHWRAKHTATGTPCSGCAAAVLPIVAEEVRKAKAEAWQEGVNFALPNAETTWYPQHNPYRATHYPEETP